MARMPKPISVIQGHRSKSEKQARAAAEEAFSMDTKKVKAPPFLTLPQRKIFKFIVGELMAAEALGNLDLYVLTQAAITIERVQEIDKKINDDINLLASKTLHNIRSKYMAEFFKLCGELALSPTARAKIGTLAANKKKQNTDPLLRVLSGK